MTSLVRRRIRGYLALPAIDLQEEVAPYLRHLNGLVLNAGAGRRPVATGHPTLSCDFDAMAPVDFLADLHYLPLRDACVDSILSVAVLEHTRNPWVCLRELNRVLRPGGSAVICVPFLQPEHAVPHDFFRFTAYGLDAILQGAGFRVESVDRLGRQERAVGWILWEKWNQARGPFRLPLLALASLIARRARTGNIPPVSVYTGSYAVARKPGPAAAPHAVDVSGKDWFFPLLVDPVTKGELHARPDGMENDQGYVYERRKGKLDLRPPHGLSQDAARPWQ